MPSSDFILSPQISVTKNAHKYTCRNEMIGGYKHHEECETDSVQLAHCDGGDMWDSRLIGQPSALTVSLL